ncbi:MAG: AIR synthase family protein [Armatimonadota bacterium]
MQIGKLSHHMLSNLLSAIPRSDRRVLAWPGIGIDAAVLDMGDSVLVAKTDPITFASDRIGWYAVHINANDVAVCGAEPRWFMASVLLPQSADSAVAQDVFAQILDACGSLGAFLVGGHTEITYGIDRPIVVGCMLGEAEKERFVTAAGAQPGDLLVLAGAIAIEGCAVLAREVRELLIRKGVPHTVVERASRFLEDPGISVVRQARIALEAAAVHAMHDPTEGGLATALHELAQASGVGIAIWAERVPVLPECVQICTALGIDPLGLLASGSLLIALPPADAERAACALVQAGYQAQVIGECVDVSLGLTLERAGRSYPMPMFRRDELARVFDEMTD